MATADEEEKAKQYKELMEGITPILEKYDNLTIWGVGASLLKSFYTSFDENIKKHFIEEMKVWLHEDWDETEEVNENGK